MPVIDIEKQRESEEEFNLWLASIQLVDKDGQPIPTFLEDDDSDDPEGDRQQ